MGRIMMVVVVMGVAGCGKSTVGPLIARELGGDFAEGDTFHPPANVAKMSRGEPLDDSDRMPWLAAMADAIRVWQAKEKPTVLACSALRQRYRDILAGGSAQVRFVFLRGAQETIADRIGRRRDHFMPPSLLESQFATLEEPADAIAVDVGGTPEAIAAAALERLRA
jgi:gluconokinase